MPVIHSFAVSFIVGLLNNLSTSTDQWLKHLGIHVISLWWYYLIVYMREDYRYNQCQCLTTYQLYSMFMTLALLFCSDGVCIFHITTLITVHPHINLSVFPGDKCSVKCKTNVITDDLLFFWILMILLNLKWSDFTRLKLLWGHSAQEIGHTKSLKTRKIDLHDQYLQGLVIIKKL